MTVSPPCRPPRVRQDLYHTPALERRINDLTACDGYQQQLLDTIRLGADPNAAIVVEVFDGYVAPSIDAARTAVATARHAARVAAHRRAREHMIRTLRRSPAHQQRSAFERLLVETEYYTGLRVWTGADDAAHGGGCDSPATTPETANRHSAPQAHAVLDRDTNPPCPHSSESIGTSHPSLSCRYCRDAEKTPCRNRHHTDAEDGDFGGTADTGRVLTGTRIEHAEPVGSGGVDGAQAWRHAGTHRDDHDPNDDTAASLDEPCRLLTDTPSYIRGTLRPYQIDGVNWLLQLFSRCVNGILADEMGLGKTFQTIAFLAHLTFTAGVSGPHLVVCPKSVMGNWTRELKHWCPGLSVYRFHAPRALRPALLRAHLAPKTRPIRYDVVVTTFEMILEEMATFGRVGWCCLVVDEAHKLKNDESKAHGALSALTTAHRLIITGTPLQNNLRELWALLHFLAPALFDDASAFRDWFDAASGQQDVHAMTNLHKILAPMMLRRRKSEVSTGIPAKREIYVACQLSTVQREWYIRVLAKDAELLNRSTGSVSSLNNVLMNLRKVINHPYLMDGGEDGPPFVTDEKLVRHSGKMIILDKLLHRLHRDVDGAHKVLLFSQFTSMLNILEDYCHLRHYRYCRIDGNTDGYDRDRQMALFNAPQSEYFIFLLSTRAGGLGINLQAANHVVLYDSDWNPQMDLQAQDRAHRIGQRRTVRVYRLVTDGTVEERMYRRALKKLYLDALVVRRRGSMPGADVSSAAAASREELLSMIKFGAEEIFHTRRAEVNESDMDRLLADGESRVGAMASEARVQVQMSLASFELGAEEANMYEFEGMTYRPGVESRMLHIELPPASAAAPALSQSQLHAQCAVYGEVVRTVLHPRLTEALVLFRSLAGAAEAKRHLPYAVVRYASRTAQTIVTSEMISQCLGGAEKLGRGHRHRETPAVAAAAAELRGGRPIRSVPPRMPMPKPPRFHAYQLYNMDRLLQLHRVEVARRIDRWRRRCEQEECAPRASGTSQTHTQPTDTSGKSYTTTTTTHTNSMDKKMTHDEYSHDTDRNNRNRESNSDTMWNKEGRIKTDLTNCEEGTDQTNPTSSDGSRPPSMVGKDGEDATRFDGGGGGIADTRSSRRSDEVVAPAFTRTDRTRACGAEDGAAAMLCDAQDTAGIDSAVCVVDIAEDDEGGRCGTRKKEVDDANVRHWCNEDAMDMHNNNAHCNPRQDTHSHSHSHSHSDEGEGVGDRHDGSYTTATAEEKDGGSHNTGGLEEDVNVLTDVELDERERLLQEGFGGWSGSEYRAVVQALTCGTIDVADYAAIWKVVCSVGARSTAASVDDDDAATAAADMDGEASLAKDADSSKGDEVDRITIADDAAVGRPKTVADVRDYVTALLERGEQCIPNFQRVRQRIRRAQAILAKRRDEHRAARWKMEQYTSPETQLTFRTKGDARMDREIFLAAYDAGMSAQNIGHIIKKSPANRFNVWCQSRSEAFFGRRLYILLTSIKREWEKPDGVDDNDTTTKDRDCKENAEVVDGGAKTSRKRQRQNVVL